MLSLVSYTLKKSASDLRVGEFDAAKIRWNLLKRVLSMNLEKKHTLPYRFLCLLPTYCNMGVSYIILNIIQYNIIKNKIQYLHIYLIPL